MKQIYTSKKYLKKVDMEVMIMAMTDNMLEDQWRWEDEDHIQTILVTTDCSVSKSSLPCSSWKDRDRIQIVFKLQISGIFENISF